MARDLLPQLTALLAGGHCRSHTTLDVTLGDGSELRLATAEVQVGTILYQAQLVETGALKMSLLQSVDRVAVSIQNVDKVMGQVITGVEEALNGARASLGIVFINTDTGAVYYDERMPGEIVGAALDETVDPPVVSFSVVSDIDAAPDIVGMTVSEAFPVREPLQTEVRPDPNDAVPPVPIGGGGGARRPIGGGDGRYDRPFDYANVL